MTQAELARLLGISTQQYGKYERGENRLSVARSAAIDRLFREAGERTLGSGFAESGAAFAPSPSEVDALVRALSTAREEIDRALALSRRF